MFRLVRIGALSLLVALIVSCDQAGDLIPGGGDETAEATPTASATPFFVQPTLTTGTDTPTPTPSVADHELARSVVEIEAIDTSTGLVQPVRDGSGVIVDREAGLILTAYPIVRPYLRSGARAYTVIGIGVNDGNGGSPRLAYEAELIAADEQLDLAVLRVTREYQGDPIAPGSFEFPAAEPGDSTILEPGSSLRLFGHPGLEVTTVDSQALTVTDGTVTGRRGEPDRSGTTRFRLDAVLPYGSTGGPAFNRGGALVGMLVPEHYEIGAPVTQLRPLSLALELIDSARGLPTNVDYVPPLQAMEPSAGFLTPGADDGIWVSRPVFAETATSSGGTLNLVDYERGFLSGTQELYFEFAVQGAETGANVEERWYLNDVLQDSVSSSYTWEHPQFALVSDVISAPASTVLPDGRWRLEVWINGIERAASTAIIGVELEEPQLFNATFGSLAGTNGLSVLAPSAAAQQILMFFDYTGMDITSGVRWVVLRDGELMYQSTDQRWQGGGSGRYWVGYSSEEPIGSGRWDIQILVDGEVALEAAWDT
jgi:hypothetical protein